MAEIQAIGDVDAAKSWLLQNQDGIAGFEKKYGEGSAVAVLEGTYNHLSEPEGPSMFEVASAVSDFDEVMVVDTLQGIGRGIISAPTELVETITNINTIGTEQANSILTALLTTRNQRPRQNDGKPPMSPEEEADFRERLQTSVRIWWYSYCR